MTLGNLMFITADFLLVNFIWLHVSVSSWVWSDFRRILPKRNEPKKATQQADQNTVLLSWDQLLVAISWPIIFSKGNDITNLDLFVMAEYRDTLAPFSITLMKKIIFEFRFQVSDFVRSFQIQQVNFDRIQIQFFAGQGPINVSS
jgi:hypothetical protein